MPLRFFQIIGMSLQGYERLLFDNRGYAAESEVNTQGDSDPSPSRTGLGLHMIGHMYDMPGGVIAMH